MWRTGIGPASMATHKSKPANAKFAKKFVIDKEKAGWRPTIVPNGESSYESPPEDLRKTYLKSETLRSTLESFIIQYLRVELIFKVGSSLAYAYAKAEGLWFTRKCIFLRWGVAS